MDLMNLAGMTQVSFFTNFQSFIQHYQKKRISSQIVLFHGHSNPTNNNQNPLAKPDKSFLSITIPLEIPDKTKLHPQKFHKLCQIPCGNSNKAKKTKTQIPHYFFLVTLRNSTSLLINVWKFILFLSPLVKIPYPPCVLWSARWWGGCLPHLFPYSTFLHQLNFNFILHFDLLASQLSQLNLATTSNVSLNLHLAQLPTNSQANAICKTHPPNLDLSDSSTMPLFISKRIISSLLWPLLYGES